MGKSAHIKNPAPLFHWLNLLTKQWDGTTGDIRVEQKSTREYVIHRKNYFYAVNPYMRVRFKERSKGLAVSTAIFPGKKYLFGALVLLVVIAFSAWFNLNTTQALVIVTFYLIAAHLLYWKTAAKLRQLRGIILYIARNDAYPSD